MSAPAALTRGDMLAALEALGDELARCHVDGRVYVVGRAAIVLGYHADLLTRGIDARIDPADMVQRAVEAVAGQRGLPIDWLNDAAAAFIPGVDVNGGAIVLDRPGLSVRAAPAEVVLAMKLLAAREKDVADVRLLAGILGLTTTADVVAIFDRYFAEVPSTGVAILFPAERERALAMIEDIFGTPAEPRRARGKGARARPARVRGDRRID